MMESVLSSRWRTNVFTARGAARAAAACALLLVSGARADMLWSAINPRPAAIDRAAVRVDPSATTDNKANLGTLGGRFTAPNAHAVGDGPARVENVIGTLPALWFDGANDNWYARLKYTRSDLNNSRALHVFMVHKDISRTANAYRTYMELKDDDVDGVNNGAAVRLQVGADAKSNSAYLLDGSHDVYWGVTAADYPAIMEYKVSASGPQVTGVGAMHFKAASYLGTSTGKARTTTRDAAFHHTVLWLGDRGDGTRGDFYMGEFLLFTGDDAISDAEADAVVTWLKRKWLGTPAPVEGVVRVPAGETGHVEHATLTCAASTVFDVAAGATLFIDCPIVDGAAASTFVKRGAGTLVLTRACPMSGQIVVEAGKLELRGAGSLPNAKVNGTLTLGAGAAATFSASAAPLPAALKKAVVWVDPSVSNARIPANLGTAGGTFTAPNGAQTGPAYATGKFSGASGSLPALSFWGSGDYGEDARVLNLTGFQNTSRSLRVFMVHQDNGKRSNYAGYMEMRNSAYGFNTDGGKDFWICANGNNNEARLIGNSKTIASGNGASSAAIMEYNIKPASASQISGVGALHYKASTTRGTSNTANLSAAYNHDALWLGDRGDNKRGMFNLGEFLVFFGDGLNGEALSDSEANEVVAYLRRKWLGATTLVENDSNPAPTALAVEAGDTATLNGSAAPGLVKTGAGTLKVSGAVSALTVNAGAVEFTGDAPTVDALTLADGVGIVYNGVAGAAGTLTVPADATVTVTLGAAADRRLEEQTILSVTDGPVTGTFIVSAESARRWSVKVIGNEVRLLKNSGLIIVVR